MSDENENENEISPVDYDFLLGQLGLTDKPEPPKRCQAHDRDFVGVLEVTLSQEGNEPKSIAGEGDNPFEVPVCPECLEGLL